MSVKSARSFLPALALLAGFAIGPVACTPDPAYTIKTDEIDLSVTVFEDGITIPVNGSVRLSVSDLLDKAGEDISDYVSTAEDGTIVLSYDGSVALDDAVADMDLASLASLDGFSADVSYTHPLTDYLDPAVVALLPTSGTFQLPEDLVVDISQRANLKIEGIPSEVLEIKELLLDNVRLQMSEAFEGLPSGAVSTDLTFTLPDYFEPNVVTLKGKTVGGKITSSPLRITRIAGVVPDEGAIIREVGVTGTITIAKSTSIDVATVRDGFGANLKVSISNSEGKIKVSKATVVLAYDVEQSSNVSLDVPEALKDMELDLYDPGLTLSISSNLGVPMKTDIDIIPVIAGVDGTPVTISNISLPCSASASRTSTNTLYIGKYESSKPAGAEFRQADLSALLKHLPDELRIVLRAHVLPSDAIIETDAHYTLGISYHISMPLKFGSDLIFAPEPQMIDLSEASSFLSGADFSLSGKYQNTTPLGLAVTIDLLDANQTPIASKPGSGVLNIAAASSGDFSLGLSPAEEDREIAWAKVSATVTVKGNQPLKKSDYVELSNFVVRAGGISINPKDI